MIYKITRENLNRIAIIEDDDNKYTYEELHNEVIKLANIFKSAKKNLVLIKAKNDFISLVGYLAAIYTNNAVMLLNNALDEDYLHYIINSYHPKFIIGNINHSNYVQLESNIYKSGIPLDYPIHNNLALLLSTSGTTGSRKFVRLSKKNIISNAESIADFLGISSEDRGLVSLPISYAYGLSIVNSHLYAGATLLLSNYNILSDRYWEYIQREKATSMGGVPYSYQLFKKIGFLNRDFPHLRYFTQAGGRLNDNLVKLFGDYAISKGKKFFIMYGQTEATARISYLPSNLVLKKLGSIGKAIPGGILKLDSNTSEIIYEGPNVMMGYADNISDLEKGDELQGKLYTGDIGNIDNEGYFYIKGRLKRIIKPFGLRINLDEVESMIELNLNISTACIGDKDENLVIFIDQKIDIKKVNDLIVKFNILHRHGYRIEIINNFPRLANGKIDYKSLENTL